jgi:hypothetical protein
MHHDPGSGVLGRRGDDPDGLLGARGVELKPMPVTIR